ncbi:FixH family protein [Paenibacillus prosopidis]|uniref:FixH protein n=1 Tax=Paenibacillus prosopidis TaxID=630520 RepID=A0A368WB43_9BACL|nr:FixH family protein [Paenibacillus prosopidis]RCW50303.1 FixH protein [Paenibacillus prosopidis]
MMPLNKSYAPIYKLIAVTALLIVFALTWIQSSEEAPPPITEHSFEIGHAIWTIRPYPAKVLKNNTFTLELTDSAGTPLQGASLAIKLDMIGMVCGDVVFKMKEASPGHYTGEGIPLMAGMWKATLTIENGDKTYALERHLQAVR